MSGGASPQVYPLAGSASVSCPRRHERDGNGNSWNKRFDIRIALPDGSKIATLDQARRYWRCRSRATATKT